MADGRSNRKARVVPFLGRVERDRKKNLDELISKSQLMKLEGFESVIWNDSTWDITAGRLAKLTGKNTKSTSINFDLAPNLGGKPMHGSWAEVAKSLFVLRFHRANQAVTNQRTFITAIGYVAHAADSLGLELFRLTPEALNKACELVDSHYKSSTAYNLHKHIAEFAAHCDANGLCTVLLQFKYSKMKRPDSTGGIEHKRLDDPGVMNTESEKMVDPTVFRVIGELYQKVPKEHKYRTYILILTLLACLGRRFSEISLLPHQTLKKDEGGKSFIEYFPRKTSRGDVYTPKRRLFLPSDVVPIVEKVLIELEEITLPARETAEEMQKNYGPDMRFIARITPDQKLYPEDLAKLSISPRTLSGNGWLRKNHLTWPDPNFLTIQGFKPANPTHYTNKAGVIAYCKRDFNQSALEPIHIDQQGREYKLKDLCILRHLGLSSGTYAPWLATQCTHSMFTTFLRYFPPLAMEFTSSSKDVDFTSHHFRHTMNTLIDEGGLSDLLQTEWFGRTNPQDTKAYQHTSREKRALMLREDIKKGKVDGKLAREIQIMPVASQDAVLKARIQAVHDVGTGICVHNFSQTPCKRHLQCSADCNDYVWVKDDEGRVGELKRLYAITKLSRQTVEKQLSSGKPKKSADWLLHNNKKLVNLTQQLADNGIDEFDVEQYWKEANHG